MNYQIKVYVSEGQGKSMILLDRLCSPLACSYCCCGVLSRCSAQ
uniref:Uncharacterized protein n=1 Tax=Anguilla anguilla TaxID=7936 RepID=A0A0E9RIG9_ANGAN